jgi:hypothetical protein
MKLRVLASVALLYTVTRSLWFWDSGALAGTV